MKPKEDSIKLIQKLDLSEATGLRVAVWRMRTSIRDRLKGRDILDVHKEGAPKAGKRVHYIYRRIDKFMADFFPGLAKVTPKKVAVARVKDMIDDLGFEIAEADEDRPWGAFYRLSDHEAERFIHDFFPGLTVHDAKLGHSDVVLSPKFLLVTPGAKLSWQFHHRRAELWRFLTVGSYYKSDTDVAGKRYTAKIGESVQFAQGERHRASAEGAGYVLIAEIWQHTDPKLPSDESDIVRLEDDYNRA